MVCNIPNIYINFSILHHATHLATRDYVNLQQTNHVKTTDFHVTHYQFIDDICDTDEKWEDFKTEEEFDVIYEYRNMTQEEAMHENKYKLQTSLFTINGYKDLQLPKSMKEKAFMGNNGNLIVSMTDKPLVNITLGIDWIYWNETKKDTFINCMCVLNFFILAQ